MIGTVKSYDSEKGFGFISLPEGVEVFVHHSDIQSGGFQELVENQRVEFEVEQGDKGPRAIQVHPV